MRIGIDCRVLTRRPTGISKLLVDAIIAISNYVPKWELYLFAPENFHPEVLPVTGKSISIIICPLPMINKHLLWYNTMFVYQCKKNKVDICWSPFPERPFYSSSKIRHLVTVHDVVALEYKNTRADHKSFISENFSGSILKADMIWCNSHYTKDKINEYFANRKQKDVIVGASCSELFRYADVQQSDIQNIKSKYGIRGKFLLFVGTLEPRKNLSFLLDVMQKVNKVMPTLKLLVVGGKGWKFSNIKEKYESPDYPRDAVIFADYVDIQTLKSLYCIADVFVSAALNEGFGLPQLEAMRCGCPVVTSHNSAMIEVVGGRGITVKGFEIDDWCNAIYNALDKGRDNMNYDLSEYEWQSIISNLKKYVESHYSPC